MKNKVGRLVTAVLLAFGPALLTADLAYSSDLKQAQLHLAEAQQEVIDAQEALSSASAAVISASQAVASASADVESSAQSGSLTETFANGVIQTGVQVLLNGSTPIASTGNPYLGKNSFTANVTSGVIYVNQYPADFEIRPPSPATYVEFYTYARNGNQIVTVTFTDNTTDTFINYNGVGNSACPGYECLITYTAPEGKQIQSLYFPSDFDIFMIDNVTFTTEVYNDELVQILNDATAAYDQALVEEGAAQARYDLAVSEVARLQQLVIDLTPFLNAPTNLQVTLTDTGVDLTWDAPALHTSGLEVERYAIMWSTTNWQENGWAWSHDQEAITIPLNILDDTGILGNEFQFAIRADNDTEMVYSNWSNVVSLVIDAPEPPAEPDWWQVQWYEGQDVNISIMDEGLVFTSVTAWYGSPTDDNCGADVTEILTEIVVGANAASWTADNELFGDTCNGVVKVLRFAATVGQAIVEPESTESPSISPEPSESPTASPEPSESPSVSPEPIVPEPSPEPSPDTTPEPQPAPEPEPQPSPEPTPQPTPEPQPVEPEPTPSEEPVQEEQIEEPEPVVSETPLPAPTPEPEPSSTPEPTQQPSPSATPEPTTPVTKEPTPTPSPVVTPSPTPSPIPTIIPEPVEPKPEKEVAEETINTVLTEIADVSEITSEQKAEILEQKEVLIAATNEIFASAEPGSEEYEQALEILLVIAEADDPELPEELAAIPLLGDVAGAALEVFNDLGNVGADISPEVREQSEKVVIASVIVANIALTATSAATSAAAVAARRP